LISAGGLRSPDQVREAKMALSMRRIAILLAVLLVAPIAACKSPPPHTDSTKGTRSDTGMHDGAQM
jgi:hypothetical protein